MNEKLTQIMKKLKIDKKTFVILLIGAFGVCLLVISEFLPEKEKDKETQESGEAFSAQEYTEYTEKRLTDIISRIDGAGEAAVMVTLDCSDENVYAYDEKISDSSSDSSFIRVDSGNDETGVLLKVTEPKIRGVAVVCAGGDDPAVRQKVINTVTAVLDVSSARVNIEKMKNTLEDNYEH